MEGCRGGGQVERRSDDRGGGKLGGQQWHRGGCGVGGGLGGWMTWTGWLD